jgi:hypothetical protein
MWSLQQRRVWATRMRSLLLLVLISVCWADHHLSDSYTPPDQDRVIHIQGKGTQVLEWASDEFPVTYSCDAWCLLISGLLQELFPSITKRNHASGAWVLIHEGGIRTWEQLKLNILRTANCSELAQLTPSCSVWLVSSSRMGGMKFISMQSKMQRNSGCKIILPQ